MVGQPVWPLKDEGQACLILSFVFRCLSYDLVGSFVSGSSFPGWLSDRLIEVLVIYLETAACSFRRLTRPREGTGKLGPGVLLCICKVSEAQVQNIFTVLPNISRLDDWEGLRKSFML